MDDSTLIDEQGDIIKIDNLADYTRAITNLRNQILDEGRSETLFFRGQSNISWDIRPSIFRESLIGVEDKIIQKAISRVPYEFSNCITSFEVLTKLQHYGLPTRLLDVTMNPLVALYFACCSPDLMSRKDGIKKCTDGVVYVSSAYGEHDKAYNVKLLSSIAQVDVDGDTLMKLRELLGVNETIEPHNFINLIQSNLFVIPSYSNSRIVCQSGAFLLSGAIMISDNSEDIWNSKVQKSVCNLNTEFGKEPIYISGEAKEQILDELDFVNINEGTLFPELEHQMSHIKRMGTRSVTELIPEFIKYEFHTFIDTSDVNNGYTFTLGEEDIETIIRGYVKDYELKEFITNYSSTMQQAMFVMFFFVMIFVLMSGLITPVESMPEWAQTMTLFTPPRYFVDAMRSVYLKGTTVAELWTDYVALAGFAVVLNLWAALSYRKRV